MPNGGGVQSVALVGRRLTQAVGRSEQTPSHIQLSFAVYFGYNQTSTNDCSIDLLRIQELPYVN
jgi:hypothetical protein